MRHFFETSVISQNEKLLNRLLGCCQILELILFGLDLSLIRVDLHSNGLKATQKALSIVEK